MDLNDVTPDPEKLDGVWIDYGDDAAFLVASNESEDFKKALEREQRRYPPHQRNDQSIQVKTTREAMAQAMLLDFRGITENDKALKNTIENRRKILDSPPLLNFIANAASDISNFRAEGEAADAAALKSGD